MNNIQRSGYVTLIGRPNVGKSTLLNKIIGKKVSITSPKPQTTRHHILGIKTSGLIQAVYVDTPGLQQSPKHALNRYMNRAATTMLENVDVIIFMISSTRWSEEDEWILEKLKQQTVPIILALNKVDKMSQKQDLLPFIKTLSEKFPFKAIIPISAKKGTNIDKLEAALAENLPEAAHGFPAEQVSDRSNVFMASELIREQLMRHLHQEIPYGLAVVIEKFELQEDTLHIDAIIYVEKENHKAIVIGKQGSGLKRIGIATRGEMEYFFKQHVYLNLWVKVKENWTDDDINLPHLGYE